MSSARLSETQAVDLAGKSALVTGGASGIGLACVERLAAAGAEVIIVDRDEEAALKVADRLQGRAVQADLSDPAVLDALDVTAKHGLEGLSKVVALEGGPYGVTSNCINPGYVRTPLVEKQVADQARAHGISESEVLENVFLARSAVKRLGEPSEIAELAVYLCSPQASYINGASLPIDGGWTAG